MRGIAYRLCQLAVWLAPALWSCPVFACDVPVFRYALELWDPGSYQAVVFYREPLTAEQRALVASLENTPSNLKLCQVNVVQEASSPWRPLWDAQENPATPWLVLKYPKETGIERPAWAGQLSADAVRFLVESPARRRIAQKLLGGDAIIWLLLESGDKRRDDQSSRLLETELRKLEKSLVLPEPSPFDPPSSADLPLKIAFSTVRVARSDPAERMLVNLLLNWNTNLAASREPMLFLIFGRGRVIPLAAGDEIQAEAVQEAAEFLTGPCSCEVKEMNPGYDLLLSADWSSLPAEQESSRPLPPLVGLSQFAATAAGNPPGQSFRPGLAAAVSTSASVPAGSHRLARNLVVVSGSGLLFLALATLVLKAKSNAGRREQLSPPPTSEPSSETARSDQDGDTREDKQEGASMK